jgi:signal transduction histidine kinase/FixJ family two-component response regulator
LAVQLVLFTFSLITFSVNLYFLGILWFADKHTSEVRSLIAMGVATCYWTVFDAVAMIAQPFTYAYMYTLRSVMLVVAPYCFMWYVFHLSDSKLIKSRTARLVVWAVPGIDILLLLTNPLHRLVFAEDGFPLPKYGSLFAFHSFVAYAAIGIGLFFLFRYIIRTRPPAAFVTAWIIASMVPVVVNVLFTVGVIDMTQDIAPFGFAVIFMIFAMYSYRSRLNNFKTTALGDAFSAYKDAVVLADTEDVIIDCNTAFRTFFPDCRVVSGETNITAITAYLQSRVSADTRAALGGMTNSQDDFDGGEFNIYTPERGERTFTLTRRNVYARNGRSSGCLVILGDVSAYRTMIREINEQNGRLTELKELAESASEAKSTFLANMSHEMRTPLNAIIGLSEISLRRTLDGETRTSISKIYESGRNLLSVINDILDISKIESGRFELVPVEYYTADMINDAVNLNVVRIGDKPITFRLAADAELPVRMLGDELRVRQILNNFLSNAIKYTQEGEVELSVSCLREGGQARLRLSVRDTGAGIREEDLPDLFSEYRQVDMHSNRKIEGTGLGLSICMRLTEMMGGAIEVNSVYGEGSEFVSTITQDIVDDTPIGSRTAELLQAFRYSADRVDESDEFTYTPMRDVRALIVDDVDINLEIAKGIMEPYEMRVDCVLSGAEAVEAVRAENPRYDIIFMDHMMPDMDGVETVRVIREELGTEYARTIPVVALTANAIVGNDVFFMKNGFQGFLSKPIDLRQLDEALKRWVRNPKSERN